MEKNAVIAVFPKDEQAYKAFMDLKENERIIAAGLVTVQGEHDFKLKDSFTTRDDSGWLTGSVFGSAIGLIGGPLGVLFGGTLGALVGLIRMLHRWHLIRCCWRSWQRTFLREIRQY